MKGIFTIEQALYFGFGMAMVSMVILTMSMFYNTTEDLSRDIGMKDVIKTVNAASLKLYLESRYFSSQGSYVYMKLPEKIGGSKYRMGYNQTTNEFCFKIPAVYCEKSYLIEKNVSIKADIDSSRPVHNVTYFNKTIIIS
ncbi:hypothetical protein H0N95_01240 [Candidatus Micrarchaeota archaeon]|nr:hypothetical protein [Candidatus Micrarchaeota archaeon]